MAAHRKESTAGDVDELRLFIETVVDYAIFLLDREGRVASWNEGAKRLKGYEAEEIVGQHFSRFYPDEDVQAGKPDRELEVATAAGRIEDEGWRIRKDGSRFWANVVITAVRGPDGEIRGFGKVTRDLTERKLAEDSLRDADRLKTEFVGVVAHELRTPLTAIGGFADMLSRHWETTSAEQRHDLLARIMASVERLEALTADLLDVAHIESGQLRFDIAPTDVGQIAERLAVALTAGSATRRVVTRIERDVPRALADERKTWQVLSNLVSNALKFAPADTVVEVVVRTEGDEIVVSVRDRGKGIAQEDFGRLFQRFSRLAGARDAQPRGTGLGLYIAHSLVEGQQGRIWVESTLGEGSTFSFALPVASTGS